MNRKQIIKEVLRMIESAKTCNKCVITEAFYGVSKVKEIIKALQEKLGEDWAYSEEENTIYLERTEPYLLLGFYGEYYGKIPVIRVMLKNYQKEEKE